jgi:predicted MFS family arabinose efflux permease
MLSAVVAVGSLIGALISARRPRSRLRTLASFAALLALAELLAASAPGQASFCAVLLALGACTLLLLTSANSTVQLAADDAIRGRVMGIYLLVFIGGAAIGGPLVGSADARFGPRAGLLLAGLVSAAALLVVTAKLAHDVRSRDALAPQSDQESGLKLVGRWGRRGASAATFRGA